MPNSPPPNSPVPNYSMPSSPTSNSPMPKIRLLPEELISKIAAGEVIERPASALKELLENSLDAGAASIAVELEDAGKTLIRVKDNGMGMAPDDAELAIQRHATSKISSEEDLFAISTLGFRGEALAAIAAVSRLTVTSRTEGAAEGFRIFIEGGNVRERKHCAAEKGTIVEIRALFSHTPARLKFLKTDAVELKHCLDAVMRCALTHPEVSFQVKHNSSMVLQTPALGELRSTIASLFGTKLAKELLPVECSPALPDSSVIPVHSASRGHSVPSGSFAPAPCSIQGFIAPPYLARNDKSQQFLSVNKRWIRSAALSRAVYEGYHSLLFTQKHPVFFLYLSLEPAAVDVNIHPTKAEVKFEKKEEILKAVQDAVRKTLQQNTLIPQIEERDSTLFGSRTDGGILEGIDKALKTSGQQAKYAFEQGTQKALQVHEVAQAWPGTSKTLLPQEQLMQGAEEQLLQEQLAGKQLIQEQLAGKQSSRQVPVQDLQIQARATVHSQKLPLLRLLGQIHKTFFVAETIGGLVYIDQHAAHERVLYEKFMKQYVNKDVQVQQLLHPEIVEFSPSEKAVLIEYSAQLKEWGFELEEFGGNAWKLLAVPSLLGRLQPRESIHDVLQLFQEGRQKVLETKESIATRMACRAAVMAGDTLAVQEMEGILRELEKTELPYTCPHGRPTIMKVPVEELEKKFKRK